MLSLGLMGWSNLLSFSLLDEVVDGVDDGPDLERCDRPDDDFVFSLLLLLTPT